MQVSLLHSQELSGGSTVFSFTITSMTHCIYFGFCSHYNELVGLEVLMPTGGLSPTENIVVIMFL